MDEVSLYFHIPFCSHKCPYCHFYVIPPRLPFLQELEEGFFLEWEQRLPLLEGKKIVSIYFGGGTPPLYGVERLKRLLDKATSLPLSPDCEITIEANPEEGTLELFTALREAGFNRLSLGIQSLDDRSLQTLERGHSAKKGKEAIFAARAAGFSNISIDLMYDLPHQTEESWDYTLSELQELPIEHLSLYNLTLEPNTPFFKRRPPQPGPDLSLSLLQRGLAAFKQKGLDRYEISAFSLPGRASRHNVGYWTSRPFLGFGPSAFSYWGGSRFRNVAHLRRYVKALKEGREAVDFSETLSEEGRLRELLAVRLRLREGAQLPQELPPSLAATLEKLKREGYLEEKEGRICLSERGTLFYDFVASEVV